MTLYRSGVRHGLLNGILCVTEGRFPEALVRAKSFGPLPWLWWAGPDSYPALADDLLVAGGTEVGRMPVMAAPVDRVAGVEIPALTAAAVAEGRRRGLAVTSLQASEMGRPVYERLGLRTVAEYRLFSQS